MGLILEITSMKYDQYHPRIFRVNAKNTHFTFFFVSHMQRHIIPTTSRSENPFPNMKIIHAYLPTLDQISWRLGAKICPILVLTFKVAQGQIQ